LIPDFATDARSRFGAEVKVTDASNSGTQLAEVDATAARKQLNSQGYQRQVSLP
jgi:hypothetical protein